MHPKKLNLGVGAYRDENLKPYVFQAVRKAEEALVHAGFDKEYLPISGLAAFRTASAKLMLGSDSSVFEQKRLYTCQTLSGTGSLTIGAHLLRRLRPTVQVYASDPTWENHGKVVGDAGLPAIQTYRYWDASTRGLDFEGMTADLRAMPEGSVVILHACAHNPTGVDPTHEQWEAIAAIVRERKLLPWFDCAYQGFASGDPDTDAWAVRMFVSSGIPDIMISQSFAKNFGLYCERIGALHVITADPASAAAVGTLVEAIVRPMYSNPPAHGARIVSHVLNDTELAALWRDELRHAMERVKRMRGLTQAAFEQRGIPGDWSHITQQIGMFSYTGLTKEQATSMTDDHHVYMLDSGRINVAGLNEATVPILADAVQAVLVGSSLDATTA